MGLRRVVPAAALLLLGSCVSLGGLSSDSSDGGEGDGGGALPDGAQPDATTGADGPAFPSDDGSAPPDGPGCSSCPDSSHGPIPVTSNAPMSDASALAAGNAVLAW